MRNEIYLSICESRKKYYSELLNSRKLNPKTENTNVIACENDVPNPFEIKNEFNQGFSKLTKFIGNRVKKFSFKSRKNVWFGFLMKPVKKQAKMYSLVFDIVKEEIKESIFSFIVIFFGVEEEFLEPVLVDQTHPESPETISGKKKRMKPLKFPVIRMNKSILTVIKGTLRKYYHKGNLFPGKISSINRFVKQQQGN